MLKIRKKSGIIRKKCGCGFLIGTFRVADIREF